ncbi:uncharacterized protein LOC143149669 [Ptiloglossa arizonensis]|uniref:uncharacterized protein LOC143149669 n=1 Tax=Ptiloglossa arizonensis TaxID=3350558 RepID=UPI003FA06650
MKINSFEDVIAVMSALNSIAALRNLEYPTNRWRFLFSWFYDVLVICVFSTCVIFFEVYHLKQLTYTLERLMYIFLTILYTLGFLCMVTLGLYYSKVSNENFTRITHCRDKYDKW